MSSLKRASRILKAKLQRVSRFTEQWSASDFESEPEFEDLDESEFASGADERKRALETLELQPGASQAEIRSAYRQLCVRYHPDYFAGDEAKSAAANELLSEINRAYEVLTSEAGSRR